MVPSWLSRTLLSAVVASLALAAGCTSGGDAALDTPSMSSSATPADPQPTSGAEGPPTESATPDDAQTESPPGAAPNVSAPSESAPSEPVPSEPAPSTAGAPLVGIRTLPPVPAREAAPFGDGLVATVTGVEEVQLAGVGPGETAGPGVAVRLELRNDSDQDVDLGGLAVNASYGDDIPAIPNSSAPAAPVTGLLAPGDRRSGIYAFRVPQVQADTLVVEVQHSGSENIVLIQL